ncbi:MAG: hypothetical protein QXH10_07300 [Ignisphaera sp.]
MNKTMFAVIPLILLTILGSALAMWYDVLKIRAIVETGSVDVEFSGRLYVEDFENKDVARCSARYAEIENEDANNPFGNNDLELSITVDNAYPCYICKVNTVYVKNVGSIPVHVKIDRIIASVAGSPTAGICEQKFDPNRGPYFECDVDNDGDADINLWGCFTSFLRDIQLHPGKEKSFTVELHVKQGAEENSSFTIQIYLKARQYNE